MHERGADCAPPPPSTASRTLRCGSVHTRPRSVDVTYPGPGHVPKLTPVHVALRPGARRHVSVGSKLLTLTSLLVYADALRDPVLVPGLKPRSHFHVDSGLLAFLYLHPLAGAGALPHRLLGREAYRQREAGGNRQ